LKRFLAFAGRLAAIGFFDAMTRRRKRSKGHYFLFLWSLEINKMKTYTRIACTYHFPTFLPKFGNDFSYLIIFWFIKAKLF